MIDVVYNFSFATSGVFKGAWYDGSSGLRT